MGAVPGWFSHVPSTRTEASNPKQSHQPRITGPWLTSQVAKSKTTTTSCLPLKWSTPKMALSPCLPQNGRCFLIRRACVSVFRWGWRKTVWVQEGEKPRPPCSPPPDPVLLAILQMPSGGKKRIGISFVFLRVGGV